MHGPGRANLERSNQSAHEQSAQPEETPPRRAGKRAKACLRAISVAACGSEWTSRPASFSKNWTIAGSRHAPGSPAPAHSIHEEVFIANQKPAILAHDCGTIFNRRGWQLLLSASDLFPVGAIPVQELFKPGDILFIETVKIPPFFGRNSSLVGDSILFFVLYLRQWRNSEESEYSIDHLRRVLAKILKLDHANLLTREKVKDSLYLFEIKSSIQI